MAEAAVDGTPMSRFFCHRCSVEIEHLLPDYTCPNCSSGFIEELDAAGNDGGADMDISSEDLSDVDADIAGFDFPQRIGQELSDLFLGLTGAGSAISTAINSPAVVAGGASSGRSSRPGSERRVLRARERIDPVRPGRHTALISRPRPQILRDRARQVMPVPIEHLIQDFILNLSGVGWGVPVGQGQPPVLFLGNPGDYVWGRDGLDAIVTQLLNQMEGTGPPPLPRDQIDQIPSTLVSQEQVDGKLQCSVCWEDFRLAEPVRQLPCQHFYHAPCIVPWLELHGTCPICRQSLGDQNSVEANQDTVAPSLAALFRAANESNSSRTSSTSSTSTGSSSSSDSTNEI
ncbi:E3 ubiquitin-protein ligase RNF126-B isoform X1 [Neodiprion pinetum]|uniref:RING-type E3 ubiquitin transferase n=2 Tax=Neodiprion TaxID=270857 RepID=A0A6J0B7I3_NEOLC|nr:E3 ubiquitin-protein ligase RNF126-B isoform X1 [Neodiprion lecontei]XP_015510961.1 E3 ubiquitin-protein ligase RNF126-B isoform X1 [Neodiprion lecontei]XP_046413206.1 E3 ubiquitin-protein ligase RNF126-B isoform X1 [Neodiprion fabricii]XP_046413207.1 E3 ubiquitin-protein ligase RNF126-B isoform X1 [Neodiprion fabricii]XP_046468773.1 E3 ubiquitin-protein ligase RNF126-B isoform X1 [Neodiprion pinetum]XP_046468774.1 E3 ubiquitin-protein ligase RNF126-B isoform X1 [Neodiprion pinetum]XP_0464